MSKDHDCGDVPREPTNAVPDHPSFTALLQPRHLRSQRGAPRSHLERTEVTSYFYVSSWRYHNILATCLLAERKRRKEGFADPHLHFSVITINDLGKEAYLQQTQMARVPTSSKSSWVDITVNRKQEKKNICLFEHTVHLTAVRASCLLCCLCLPRRDFHRATKVKIPLTVKKQVSNYIPWLREWKQSRTFSEVTINLQLSQLNVCLTTLQILFS